MSNVDTVSVIIPAFNPSETLVHVAKGLIDAGFRDIIIVNDGSDQAHEEPFRTIGLYSECTILHHPRNLGKGAALKTAFSFFEQSREGKTGVVTVDADGQHLKEDVIKCALAVIQADESVVIGVRDLYHEDMPKRNSLGNRITAFSLRLLFGITLRDTQTGLRGLPARYVPLMIDVPGNRFEYETNMLIEIERRQIAFHQVDIATVYEEGSNKRSHFRPFIDSAIIFARIFKYALSSVLSFILDIGVFWIAIRVLSGFFGPWSIPACTAIARVFSSFFNFNLNKLFVFKQKKAYGSHLWRYYTLAAVQMLVSAGLLWILAHLLSDPGAAWLLSLLKMLVDMTLFFLSYYIQRRWVFRKHRPGIA